MMLFYGVITYIVLTVIFNLPFMMEKHHFSSGHSGLMISLFFLAIIAFLILGQDRFSWTQTFAVIFICIGVYLVEVAESKE
nr:hypothetical protein [Bacteroides acidifaciens]